MIAKGVVALVCLALMAAIWSPAVPAVAATLWTVKASSANPTFGSVSPAGYFNYTTHSGSKPFGVTANPGYKISSIIVDNVARTVTASPQTVDVPYKVGTTILVAYFAETTFQCTIGSIVGGGSISSGTTPTVKQGASKSFTITPFAGTTLSRLMDNGADVAVTNPAGMVYTLTNVQSNHVISAVFFSATASAGPDQSVVINRAVTLTGSGSSTVAPMVSYAWAVTSAPAGSARASFTANTQTVNFSPDLAGSYALRLTATDAAGNSATAGLTVTGYESAQSADTICAGCHGVSRAQIFTDFNASTHGAANATFSGGCTTCHVNNETATHPGTVTSATVSATTFNNTDGTNYCATCHNPSIAADFSASIHKAKALVCTSCHVSGAHNPDPSPTVCQSCHADPQGNVTNHPISLGNITTCTLCHDPHVGTGVVPTGMTDVHFNNLTGAGYPASYLTSRAACTDCHHENSPERHAWARSGHASASDAPWSGSDFKTMSGCVQCHTTTGFIAYSTGRITAAWGVASDKTKELLTCVGCHSNVTTGAVRNVTPVRPFADDSYRNRNVGSSNLCFSCHSGTNNGKSITARVGAADFSNLPYIAPHFMAAGATLHGKAGYHFPGQTYAFYSSNSHRAVGMGNNASTGTAGPCVACHMSAPGKHRLQTITTDAAGAITGISAAVCANCHGSSLSVEKLSANQAAYDNALNVLKAALADKGYQYSKSAPYFSNTNWGSEEAGANLMGAAYNYQMLLSEPGGYAHNPAYVRKLISDSIEATCNGTITGSLDSALANLVGRRAISQQAADRLSSYQSFNTACTGCHDSAGTGSHAAHLKEGFSCAQCHNTTALDASTLIPGTASHLNGQLDVVIAPANRSGVINFNPSGHSCSGISCHGNGTATLTWGSGPVSCESCHLGTLSVIDGVTAQDRPLSSTSGHGKPGIGSQCLDCHDPSKQHLGGAGMLAAPLTGTLNTECNYCHNDTTLIQNPASSKMRAHITKNGVSSACIDCHDPHGTTNLSMIRSTILGQSITYTTAAQLVDLNSNMGFCQVCHTKTKYFLAGVPETAHDTTDCLACHDHKSPNGGFLSRPAKQCDSCHGYPPAPRQAAVAVGFGIMGNWSAAIFERYSGGGGAHLVAAHVPKNARPSEGWNNCIMCHDPGYHRVDLLVDNPPPIISHISVIVERKYIFSPGFAVYTGARMVDPPARNVTGSCFNLSCHMSPSPRWSTER